MGSCGHKHGRETLGVEALTGSRASSWGEDGKEKEHLCGQCGTGEGGTETGCLSELHVTGQAQGEKVYAQLDQDMFLSAWSSFHPQCYMENKKKSE